jgi:glycosyltransferase involved in cell wall biosynthesis
MKNFPICIGITTYNRSRLVGRAIESALAQDWPDLEIVVIDDASTDDTQAVMSSSFPSVRYFRQSSNRGIGAARNRCLAEATKAWVLSLDDDDTLLPGAVARIAELLAIQAESQLYPVYQFPRTDGRVRVPFINARVEHFLDGTIEGNFGYLFRREMFLGEGLTYPENFHSCPDTLLWLRIADKYGIPTWNEQIQRVYNDAPTRINSTSFQLQYSRDRAELDEVMLGEFGDLLRSKFPSHYEKKLLSAATYRLLAGDRGLGRAHVSSAMKQRISAMALGLWGLSFAPRPWVRTAFAAYRHFADGWAY